MKVKSESEVAQSCPTLSDPMDGAAWKARVLKWGAIAFSAQNPLPKFTPCTSTPEPRALLPSWRTSVPDSTSSPPSSSLPKPWYKRSSANNSNSSLLSKT